MEDFKITYKDVGIIVNDSRFCVNGIAYPTIEQAVSVIDFAISKKLQERKKCIGKKVFYFSKKLLIPGIIKEIRGGDCLVAEDTWVLREYTYEINSETEKLRKKMNKLAKKYIKLCAQEGNITREYETCTQILEKHKMLK